MTAVLAAHYPVESSSRSTRLEEPRETSAHLKVWMAGGDLVDGLRVRLDFHSELVTALEPTTGVFGSGGDVASAVEDLRAALSEHLEVLESETRLSSALQEQLMFLRMHLRTAR